MQRRLWNTLKLSIKWSILGFFLPLIGIVVGKMIYLKNESRARSIMRGSAISAIILVLGGFFLIYLLAMNII